MKGKMDYLLIKKSKSAENPKQCPFKWKKLDIILHVTVGMKGKGWQTFLSELMVFPMFTLMWVRDVTLIFEK